MTQLKILPIHLIDSSPHNPRQVFDADALTSLADSITRLGVLQPILVTRNPTSERYTIIAGERRWRASRLAKKTKIPAIVVELDDPVIREVQLIENLEREQLNPIDEALALQSLQEQFGYSEYGLAQRLKRSYQFVRGRLELLKLDERVQQFLRDNTISIMAALELAQIEDGDVQFLLAQQVLTSNLTALETATRVTQYKIQQRLAANQAMRRLNLEQRTQVLAAHGVVVRAETYDPKQHHRTWDLVFAECAACQQKGQFLRNDGQVEDVCVTPDCYANLLAQQRSANERINQVRRGERRRAFEKVLDTDEVRTEHLQYLFWSMLNLMGPMADGWRREFCFPLYSDDTMHAGVWDLISTWSDEELLTNIMRLNVSYLAALNSPSLPEGLKRSLVINFDIDPQIVEGIELVHETSSH